MTAKEMKDKGYYNLFGNIYRFFQNADVNDWNKIVHDADALCG